MRTQVIRAGLLAVTLAGSSVAVVGCDDYSTGHPADPAGPVKLVRIMVQDSPASVTEAQSAGNSTRGGAVDLLDNRAPDACDDTSPCKVLLAMQGGLADFTCRSNVCNDPLKLASTGVPLNPD